MLKGLWTRFVAWRQHRDDVRMATFLFNGPRPPGSSPHFEDVLRLVRVIREYKG